MHPVSELGLQCLSYPDSLILLLLLLARQNSNPSSVLLFSYFVPALEWLNVAVEKNDKNNNNNNVITM
jgi:hypothetical protein